MAREDVVLILCLVFFLPFERHTRLTNKSSPFFSFFASWTCLYLQVHFKNGMGGDPRLSENVDDLLKVLDSLAGLVKTTSSGLEETLQQIDVYQQQMQTLRQKIIQEEQQLRLVMAPTYLPHDRERALAEQQVRTPFILNRISCLLES